jgi:ribonucleoside-diphosphate reductase alpha chain
MTETVSGQSQSADENRRGGPKAAGLTIGRIFTTPGVHPYDQVSWERRDVVQQNWKTGETVFEQRGVEFPDFWSVNASTIVTTKYFRGAIGTDSREWSLRQLVDRVVKTYRRAGEEYGYFATTEDAEIFEHELVWMLVHQVFSFNSPVWFNVGTPSPQQVSACQPYDALVSTPAGLIPIGKLVEDDAVGTKVYDAHGVTRIVATKANGVKDVLRLHTKAGYQLDVTVDHLVWRSTGDGSGRFVEAGTLRPGDQLEFVDADFGSTVEHPQIVRIEDLGPTEVYDIQTESGEYLSGGLRVHNCFILAVDDSMDSILNWYREEGLIFKGGSGSGINLSRIRSSKELLSSGGTASGPVSFMRGADASAGTIKSGGATRRAAKMVVLDVDHPDVEEFIETKAREEDKIRALRDAGFDMDLGGKDIVSVQYQNANNSIRVSDEFMQAVQHGDPFGLRARLTGEVVETVDAKSLFRKMAQAAWECADPGIQYDSTINDWHTNPETGRITASNPCSEYLSLDNSSCNLASLNLMKFLRDDDTFDADLFRRCVELIITAMDISISFADFPTQAITETTRAYRQLGIGYANLGALLMATGHGYDSEGGRSLAAAITSLMTGAAYTRSAELAGVVGPYDGYARNEAAHKRVMRKHAAANGNLRTLHDLDQPIHLLATEVWQECLAIGERNGWRNAQASLLAPTGTIGLALDCDTTGIEPDLALVKFKKLVGGGSMQIVNQTVPRALRRLGYQEEQIEAIVEHIAEHGNVIEAPGLRQEHYEVFDCAMGARAISPMGHVNMMAAVQPFLSGAISKTVNMPESATVEEIEQIYFEGWKLGLKALAIYRDNCKVGQPLSVSKRSTATAEADPEREVVVEYRPTRRRLPKSRPSRTTSFTVGGAEGYMTAGSYPDDGLGEVFLKLGKQGSTLAGVMDAFSIAISIALQYGVPLETYVQKFTNMRFEPSGMTDDPDVRMAQSVVDYIFRRLALDYLPFESRSAYGVYTAAERARQLDTGDYAPIEDHVDVEALRQSAPVENPPSEAPVAEVDDEEDVIEATAKPVPAQAHTSTELLELLQGTSTDAPLCVTCGTKMRPAGSCYVCEGCGSTSGCS